MRHTSRDPHGLTGSTLVPGAIADLSRDVPTRPGSKLSLAGAVLASLLFCMALPAAAQPLACPDPGIGEDLEYQVLADPAANAMSVADLKTALRTRGVEDMFVVKDGVHQGKLALGLFRQKSNAEGMVTRLSGLGFQARVAARPGHNACSADPAAAAPAAAPMPATPETDQEAVSVPEAVPEAVPDSALPAEALAPAPGKQASRATPVEPPEAAGCNDTRYLVLADPAANGGDVVRLVQDLKSRGFNDGFVITAERHRGMVALGIYKSADEAEQRITELTALGVQANIETMPVVNSVTGSCDKRR